MKGSEEQLLKFMDGHNKRFVIPVYQRNYDWKRPNCKQLFDDLVKVIRTGRKAHFFGSIVYAYDNDGESTKDEYLIIDGQQRLTTVSLLLLAMHDILQKGIAVSSDPSRVEEIYDEYLVDKYAPDETRIKLKPVKNDNAAFCKLFGDEEGYLKNSNITSNYQYFYYRIQKEEIGIDDLYKAIYKLQIISIRLDYDDNPQLIFESLNSTGLDLTEGDKIRNFVLMGQPKKKQNEYYEKYWNPIELATDYDVSMFVRDYLSVKTRQTPSISNVYETFKKFANDSETDMGDLLGDLLQYAKYYEILLRAGSSYGNMDSKLDEDLRYAIRRLNWMETTTTRPFLLEVLRLFFDGVLALNDLHNIFGIVESYLFRRNICEVATNALNKVFLNLNSEIARYDGTYGDYVEKLKYALISKSENGRYPNDEEFLAALSEKNIYNMRNKYRTYILERYENFGTLEVKNVYKGVEDGTYTIEHIMPQHLTPIWIDALGQDYQAIHAKWLHRIANLTLTAYNSNYGNEPFDVKKNLVDKETGIGIGLANSGLRMNQWIAEKSQWTEKELIERNEHMLNLARKIWPYASTDYRPAEKPMDSVSLAEDFVFTGRQVSKFSYKGAEQPVNSWVDAYVKILRILHQQDESVLTRLAFSDDPDVELSIHVETSHDAFSNGAEIADGIYVWTGISTQYKISNLNKFFKLYGADPEDLIFYLKDEKEGKDEREDDFRYLIRKKYWEFALPLIQAANSERGCYANVKPGTENGIAGYFGINGFFIYCVANYRGARVEFFMAKPDADDNKRAFDVLCSHKDEIEAILGDQIQWNRADDSKYSKIYITMPDVSIIDEGDWKKMAKFHAEWSRKLCDAIIPFLED